MKSYTIAEAKGQMEDIARRVIDTGEHIRLVLDDGRSVVMMPKELYERWTTSEAQPPQDKA